MGPSSVRLGGLLAVLAALAFGLVVPFTQRAGRGVGPFFTAAVLYGGAAVFAAAMAAVRRDRRAPLVRGDARRLAVVALLGAAVAPTLLAWGLQRATGTTAALLLNCEALFTVVLARLVWREPFGRRVAVALFSMTLGGALLVQGATGGPARAVTGWGAAAVVLATLAWASENVLSRPLSQRDAFPVVFAKSALGATVTAAVAVATRDAPPTPSRAVALAACGATGYGLSLALYLRAQRQIGAARTASIFALAPFAGALAAWALGERALPSATAAAAVLFATGVALHLTERRQADLTPARD